MNPQQPERIPAKPTGRRYGSVDELLHKEASQETISKVKEIRSETKLSTQLALLRHKSGITQEQMGEALGKSQSAISKLEMTCDDEITLGEIKAYAAKTGERIGVMFGKPLNHAEAIKSHALAMRSHLEDLARLANKDEELEKDISAFFGEAFFNLLNIISECNEKLPTPASTGVQVTFQIAKQDENFSKRRPNARAAICMA